MLDLLHYSFLSIALFLSDYLFITVSFGVVTFFFILIRRLLGNV